MSVPQRPSRRVPRKPTYRRVLEMEVLVGRLPVSEQFGTMLSMSLLGSAAATAATRVVPSTALSDTQAFAVLGQEYATNRSSAASALPGVMAAGPLLVSAGPTSVPPGDSNQ